MTIADASVRNGYYAGGGAALNISLGFIPKRVDIFDCTDGTVAAVGFGELMVPFDDGAVAPVPNAKFVDLTSGAKGQVKDVILVSGSWGGGNAAGFLVLDSQYITGTIASGDTINFANDTTGAADVTVSATPLEHTLYQTGAAGFVSGTGATGITPFAGSPPSNGNVGASAGFTVGSSLAVSGKLYRWTAYRM